MSNKVVYNMFVHVFNEVLRRIENRSPWCASRLKHVRTRIHLHHHLIDYLTLRLSSIFALSGGMLCPRLEEKLKELEEKDPEKLIELLSRLIEEYYEKVAHIPPRVRIEPPPWIKRKKRKKVEVYA